MATPTIISGLSVVDDFEDANLDDRLWELSQPHGRAEKSTTVYKQGTQSGGYMPFWSSGITAGVGIELTAPKDLTGQFLWIWINISDKVFASLDTIENGGVRLRLYSGTLNKDSGNDLIQDSSTWVEFWISGSDMTGPGWFRYVCRPENMTAVNSNGTFDITDVTCIGTLFHFASDLSGINAPETWIDCICTGPGVQLYGGSDTDKLSLDDIAAYTEDISRSWGILQNYKSTWFANGDIKMGDTGQDTYFEAINESILFDNQSYWDGSALQSALNNGLHGFSSAAGNVTNLMFDRSVIKASSTHARFGLDFSADTDTVFTGNFIAAANQVKFCGTCEIDGTFEGCHEIFLNDATVNGLVVNNYVGSNGAVVWGSGSTIENMQFSGCTNGISIGDGDFNIQETNFDNCNYDINHTGAGHLRLTVIEDSNVSTILDSGGGTSEIINQKIKSFSGLPENCEARIVQGSYTLAHEQDVTGGTFQFQHDVTNREATAYFTMPGYIIQPIKFLLDDTNVTYPATVQTDPSYV